MHREIADRMSARRSASERLTRPPRRRGPWPRPRHRPRVPREPPAGVIAEPPRRDRRRLATRGMPEIPTFVVAVRRTCFLATSMPSPLPSTTPGSRRCNSLDDAPRLTTGHHGQPSVPQDLWAQCRQRNSEDHVRCAPMVRLTGEKNLVELRGIEPRTSSMRTKRATNCATAPNVDLSANRGKNTSHPSGIDTARAGGGGLRPAGRTPPPGQEPGPKRPPGRRW